ncbi:MAG: putative Diphthine--ammonia ligase, partial [Streblomastix strix]
MSVCGLLSGGKDSIFNLLQCQNIGLKIEVLATLYPPSGVQELDSYMYQSVGSAGVISQARCMNLPLLRREIRGKQLSLDMGYQKVDDDEVEDLFLLLADVKNLYPSVKYISTGAIASDYQRIRVENVCKRLGLQNISFLWHIPQPILLKWMCFSGMKAHLIKVAASGLKPSKFLGRTLNEVFSQLMDQEKIYKLNVCGEGGEFESLVAYCPGLFTEGKLNINVPQREREKEDENEKGQQNEFKVKRVINGDERFGDPVAWLEFNCPPPIVSLNEDELKAISKFTLNSSEQIPIPLSTTNIFKRLLDIFLISQQDILRVGEIIQFNFIIDSQLIKDIDSYHLFQLEMDQSITQFFLEIQTKNLYNINHNPTTRLSFFQSNNYSEQINNAFLEVYIVCVESLSLGFKPIPQFTSQCIGSGPLLELSDLHIPREKEEYNTSIINSQIAPHQISYALFLRQLIQGAFIKTKYSSNQPQSVLSQLVSDKLRDIIGIVDGSLGGSFFNDCLGIIVHVCQLNYAAKELSLIKALTRKIVKNPDFFETLIPVQVKEKEKEDDGDESNDSDDGDDENELNTILSIEPSDSIKINQVIPPLQVHA